MRRSLGVMMIVAVLLLLLASPAVAKTTKYTFNDVDIDGTVVEIEAGVKDNNGGQFTQCSYFSDDYGEYLGEYGEPVVAGDTAEEVLAFCVANFEART